MILKLAAADVAFLLQAITSTMFNERSVRDPQTTIVPTIRGSSHLQARAAQIVRLPEKITS